MISRAAGRHSPFIRTSRRGRHRAAWAALFVFVAACGGDPTPAAPNISATVFTVQVVNETFKVQTSNPTATAAMRTRLASGRLGVIIGTLRAGDGAINAPYSWHLDPSTVTPADVATEVCDGRPSDVQKNLPYWMNTVQRFCPWGAKVIREGS
ncbi:MAG: hypothetical protein ABIZ91_04165 [Gemmatimonadaceae bacterium]